MKFVRALFRIFGLSVYRYGLAEDLLSRLLRDRNVNMGLLELLPPMESKTLVSILQNSKSQHGQDIFALSEAEFKSNGFFVEFGATDGLSMSNTYLLEKMFSWNGILVEPARSYHVPLLHNRHAIVDFRAVHNESQREVIFNEVHQSSLSTIDEYSDLDQWRDLRKKGKKYIVETITLKDLLIELKAPKTVDYLSIDTEGSEYQILKDFSFDSYIFSTITVEHNYGPNRDKIYKLLTTNGYERVNTHLSAGDDWYIYKH